MAEPFSAPESAPTWSSLLSGSNGMRSLALAGGVALHAVNVYLAITILPSIVRDIGGLDYYAWNTTLFAAASILGSVLAAGLFRKVGSRRAYTIATGIFAAGSLLCASAPSMSLLLTGRTVQGIGGGLLFALAYLMIRLAFAEPLWPRAMALISSMWGIATLLGPAIGGVFANLDAWRAAFWSLIPITLGVGALAYATLPAAAPDRSTPARIPFAQLALITLAVLCVSAASLAAEWTWTAAGLLAGLALGAVLLRIERLASSHILPPSVSNRESGLASLYVMIALLNAVVTASEIFVPYFVQALHRQSPLLSGYYAAAMAAGWTIGSLLTSGASERRSRQAILASPAIAAAAMAWLAATLPVVSDGGIEAMLPIARALLFAGLGVGIAWPHLLAGVLRVAASDEQNVASGAITTVQLFATAMAAAIAGIIVNAAGIANTTTDGVQRAALALLVACALLAAITILWGVRIRRGR